MTTKSGRLLDLTIAIPTLNCAPTLRWTLESIRPLQEAGAKVVVADSNSTDGTREIALAFTESVLTVPKGNMYSAINAALNHAPSGWMTYINGDDLLYADAVQAALREPSDAADVIYAMIDYIDLAGRFLHAWTSPPESELLPLFARAVMPIPQQGTLFRRKVFEQLGGFDPHFHLAGDFDFFLRAKLAGFRFERKPLLRMAAFRIFPAQMSHRSGLSALTDQARDSVRKNHVTVPRWQQEWAFLKFRLRNLDSYLVRYLRTRQLTGSFKATSTMDSL